MSVAEYLRKILGHNDIFFVEKLFQWKVAEKFDRPARDEEKQTVRNKMWSFCVWQNSVIYLANGIDSKQTKVEINREHFYLLSD